MFREKRGQLTIFIIVGIMIVLGIVLYFYLGGDLLGEARYDTKVETLRENVLDCFKETYSSSLIFTSYQGGYLNVPEPKETISGYFFSMDIPYYYHEGELNIPTIEDLKRNLKDASNLGISVCMENVNTNNTYDSVIFGEHYTEIIIEEGEVIFTTNVNMNVGYDGKSVIVDLGKTPQPIESDLLNMHTLATFIAEFLKTDNEWMPYSDIVEKSREYDLYANILGSEDGRTSTIQIMSLKEGYSPTIYQFTNKYSFEDLSDIAPLL